MGKTIKESKKSKKAEASASDSGSDDGKATTGLSEAQQSRLFVSPIAVPLASEKMSKKLIKLVQKGMKSKIVHRGVKETVKAVRKGSKGVVVIAADISPIDVLSHLPILCEEKEVPYIYIRSRAELGQACKTKRPTSCVLIVAPKSDDKKLAKAFDRNVELVKAKNDYVN